MKNKVINLFPNIQIKQNEVKEFSELFETFLKPFLNNYKDVEYYEDIFELGILAWNFGNLKSIWPEDDKAFLNVAKSKNVDFDLMQRMINYKVLNFNQYTDFIVDYDLDGPQEAPVVKLVTQEDEVYLYSMLDNIGIEESDDEFQENFIDRHAVILKPLKPFLEWLAKVFPEQNVEETQVTTYLVDEDIPDLEVWLSMKFDELFVFELDAWSTNKNQWPQKRTYKMFKEWFRVEVSTLIFDMEKSPISKLT